MASLELCQMWTVESESGFIYLAWELAHLHLKADMEVVLCFWTILLLLSVALGALCIA